MSGMIADGWVGLDESGARGAEDRRCCGPSGPLSSCICRRFGRCSHCTPDPSAAIHALQTASRYDLALGGVGFTGRFGGLYPVYVRGLAYLAAGHPGEAASEFQRILDHRSIVLVDPVDAVARLQLARALARSRDALKARAAYDDLFELGKNANSDIPLLRSTSGICEVAVMAPLHGMRRHSVPVVDGH
jgi:hypothetical protein